MAESPPNIEEITSPAWTLSVEYRARKVEIYIVNVIGGARGLFRGAFSHVVKMAMVNMTLTGPYDYMKEKIWLVFGDFGFNHFVSLLWATTWCTLLTLPFDNVKTRMMR